MKKIYLIDEEFENTRLDRWYKKKICLVPQSLFEKNIRKGKIKVNHERKKSSYKLKKNDEIIINNFDPKLLIKKNNKYIPSGKEAIATSDFVIENNENFIIINKPAGIAVQSGTKSRKNILDIMSKTKYFNDSSPYAVHRLDKETTGVLIIAKNRKYAQLFTSLFRIRKIHKTYLAVAFGEINVPKGTFKNDLYYFEGNKKIKMKAVTHYEVIDSNNNYTLLKLTPESGRKHQIRRHLFMNGYPILGDSKYKFLDNIKSKKNYLMLHAYTINFSINEKKYRFRAEPNIIFKKKLKEKFLKNH